MADLATFAYRDHLVRLIASSEAAAARLAGSGTFEQRAALEAAAHREGAALSARLDASPLTDETAARVDAGEWSRASAPVAGPSRTGRPGGGWTAALRLEGMPTQDGAAVEYENLLACYAVEPDIAADFFSAPLSGLVALHARLVEGLVDPERVGQVREVDQDVHDGAQGRVLYRTPPAGELAQLLDGLVTWLGKGSARLPALVVAGVVHGRLLEWQPFDAANGRLARAAARVVLRARGLDPAGLAVPERVFVQDPMAYSAEVAATIRRRGDLTGWLERTGEAVVWALERAADELDGGPPALPARARDMVVTWKPGEALTLPDYAEAAGMDLDTAATDLEALRRGGWVVPVPGTQGLRFRRSSS